MGESPTAKHAVKGSDLKEIKIVTGYHFYSTRSVRFGAIKSYTHCLATTWASARVAPGGDARTRGRWDSSASVELA